MDVLKSEGAHIEVMPYSIMRRKYFNPRGIVQYGFEIIKYSNKFIKLEIKWKIDLVHINTVATLKGCFVSKKLRISQLWSIHEIIVSPR